MTHAAHSHQALETIEMLMDIRDNIDRIIEQSEEKQRKLHEAIVLQNAVALLKKISRQSRTSESDRQAAKALADQLARGAA